MSLAQAFRRAARQCFHYVDIFNNKVQSSQKTLDVLALLIVYLLSTAVFIRYTANFVKNDPTLCRAMLQGGGWWLNPPKSYDNLHFRKWQPPGCLLREYDWTLLEEAFDGGRMVFLGDSTIRGPFVAFEILNDPSYLLPKKEKYRNHEISAPGLSMYQTFDSFLNSSRTDQEVAAISFNHSLPEVPQAADLLLTGAGLWHVRYTPNTTIIEFGRMLDRLFPVDMPDDKTGDKDQGSIPAQYSVPYHSWVVSPVQIPHMPDMSAGQTWYSRGDAERLNGYYQSLRLPTNVDIAWSYSAMTDYDHVFMPDDGIHNVFAVDMAKLQLIFNWRFNEQYVNDLGTCCTPYPALGWTQWTVLVTFIGLVVQKCILQFQRSKVVQLSGLSDSPFYIVLGLVLCLLADRTFVLHKEAIFFTTSSAYRLILTIGVLVTLFGKRLASKPDNDHKTYLLPRTLAHEWLGCIIMIACGLEWCGEPQDKWLHSIFEISRQIIVVSALFLLALRSTISFFDDGSSARVLIKQVIRFSLLAICLDIVLPHRSASARTIYICILCAGFVYAGLHLQSHICRTFDHGPAIIVPSALVLLIGQLLRSASTKLLWTMAGPCQIEILGTSITLSTCLGALYAGILFATMQGELTGFEQALCCKRHVSPRSATSVQILWVIVNVLLSLPSLSMDRVQIIKMDPGPFQLSFVVAVACTLGLLPRIQFLASILGWFGHHAVEVYLLHYHLWLASDGSAKLSLGLLQSITSLRKSPIPQTLDLVVLSILLCWLSGKIRKETKTLSIRSAEWLDKNRHLRLSDVSWSGWRSSADSIWTVTIER